MTQTSETIGCNSLATVRTHRVDDRQDLKRGTGLKKPGLYNIKTTSSFANGVVKD